MTTNTTSTAAIARQAGETARITTKPSRRSGEVMLPVRFDAHRLDIVDAIAPKAGHILAVDGRHVGFADATAIKSLVDARLRCLDNGSDLRVVNPSNTLRITLELTGDDALLSGAIQTAVAA